MSLPPAVDKILQDIDKKLHEDNAVTDLLAQIEAKVKIKRLHLVLGFVGIHALYLIFGSLAELLCDIIGFVYPAYISIRSIETIHKDDAAQWLTYWVTFALFNIAEFFSGTFRGYFPLYWLLKCIFLLYLYLPMTRGAQKVYYRFIHLLVQKHQSAFGKQMGYATEKLTNHLDVESISQVVVYQMKFLKSTRSRKISDRIVIPITVIVIAAASVTVLLVVSVVVPAAIHILRTPRIRDAREAELK